MSESESRRLRLELADRFAAETAMWSSKKLRAALAQPETVRRAEEREKKLTDAISANRDAWQRYALHLAHCWSCSGSNIHCLEGQRMRSEAIEGTP
jgi:hypothetical protein